MINSGFAAPVLVRSDGTMVGLRPVPLSLKGSGSYDEEWLQRLLYTHPQALPIAEIDDSFSGLIPLCLELDTPAGPVDAVFVTPRGRLALLETKLWRNPEARRKVVGQVLDYAKELTNWDYSRLDSKVRQARKAAGEDFPGIAEWVARHHPDVVQHGFQDAVTKSLARGDYLLLVAGDGIREGVGAIAQYLDRNSSLHFTFGLVECAIYEHPDGGFFVQPRVLAQTTKLTRTVLVQTDGKIAEIDSDETTSEEGEERPDLAKSHERYVKFWSEVIDLIRLEASQPAPAPGRSTNLFLYMPKESGGWVSAYLGQSAQEVGVYLRFKRGAVGERLYDALLQDRSAIETALGVKVEWHTREKPTPSSVIVIKTFRGVLMIDSREEVQRWLADHVERFVSVFRPRIERLLREQN